MDTEKRLPKPCTKHPPGQTSQRGSCKMCMRDGSGIFWCVKCDENTYHYSRGNCKPCEDMKHWRRDRPLPLGWTWKK